MEPIFWLPVIASSIVLLLGSWVGYRTEKMKSAMKDAVYLAFLSIVIFVMVYLIFNELVAAFYPERIPPMIRNWIVTGIYLPVFVLVFCSPDEWYRDPLLRVSRM